MIIIAATTIKIMLQRPAPANNSIKGCMVARVFYVLGAEERKVGWGWEEENFQWSSQVEDKIFAMLIN